MSRFRTTSQQSCSRSPTLPAGCYCCLTTVLASCLALVTPTAVSAENVTAIEARLSNAVRFLASDELEGRGIGTKGLDDAADFIAAQFEAIGLETRLFDGRPFQPFSVITDAKLGAAEANTLTLNALASQSPAETLKLGRDFIPLAAGGSAKFDLPLVFVGYGISDKDAGYDDYAGVDVKDKCVIVLRHQPQRANAHSLFGKDPSRHAFFQTKISNAYAHGAAAILFCTGQFEIDKQRASLERRWQTAVDELSTNNGSFKRLKHPSAEQIKEHQRVINRLAEQIRDYQQRIEAQQDSLLEFHRAGAGSPDRNLAIYHCRRGVLDKLLTAALNTDLATLETAIDEDGKPHSQLVPGWRISGETSIERRRAEVRNVVGVLEGEGPLANETIVVGAHYDHIGYGGEASAKPGSREIHNGADDNGSGVAALLEVARRLTALGHKLPRRIVFIAFTGEERGLLGSEYYTKNPLVPLENTIAMLNMDMVGRLKDNKLIVHGTGTAEKFDLLVQRLNAQHNFKIVKKRSGYGPSDHTSFYEKAIPVLHFFTGAHQDYHRPSDDFEKVNIVGIRRVSSLVAEAATAIAEADARPKYKKTKRTRVAGGRWPYFGSRPDYGYEKPGVRMAGVTPQSPAERGGVQTGDVIVQFGDAKIATVVDFANALSRHKAGDKVQVVVQRDGAEKTLSIILDPPRR